MIGLRSRLMVGFLKVYVAVALVVATALSPLALSFTPLLLLVWYLYLWRWPVSIVINLLTECFVFFALALLFTLPAGPFMAFLIPVPVLLLINRRLEEAGKSPVFRDTRYQRYPTGICLSLLTVVISVLTVSLLLNSLSLLLASAAMIAYLGILVIVIWRRLPLKPVTEVPVQQQMIAGTEDHLSIELISKTKIGGLLFIESPYQWLTVNPGVLSLRENRLSVKVSLAPMLAGPSTIKLKAETTDRWGLIQIRFELEPVRLHVIPRARYAAWLAKKYLTESKPGILSSISSVAAPKPVDGLRRGVEYYGNQLYQPGDSLKNIDWKHSLQHDQLITKEFTEAHYLSAVILINLTVSNDQEADELAYKIIVTATSLARENIPAGLAAYDHETVRLITPLLQPRQLVVRSLQVAQEITTFSEPLKYLNPPDVTRLRANISRLRSVKSKTAELLTQLLQLEYRNLGNIARLNPATKALTEAFAKVDKQSNIVIISQSNHDAEALAFNRFNLARKGNAVITVP